MVQFYQFLRDSGKLTEEEYQKAQRTQAANRNSTFYDAVKVSGVLTEEELLSVACEFFGYIRLPDAFRIEIDYENSAKLFGDIFRLMELRMCVCIVDEKQVVILNDAEHDAVKNKAAMYFGTDVQFALVSDAEYETIERYHLRPHALDAQASKINAGAGNRKGALELGESSSATQQLLDMLIEAALDRRASDLHIQPMGNGSARVTMRIDGKIQPYIQIQEGILENLRNKLKTLTGVGHESVTRPVEGQMSVLYKGQQIDTRINIMSSRLGYDFSIRFIDSKLRRLEELGLADENVVKFKKLLHMTKGLVILSGPTGSGKTSLLYAGFQQILNEGKTRIISIEDPVEIILPCVTQVQATKDMNYAEQLPSLLRHDPDIIGIGEIRKFEVADQAIRAAETGHLVFTTLHTNDALGAISRLVNLGLDTYTVGDVLAAVIAQRLVRRVCPYCSEEYLLPEGHEWRAKYKLGNRNIKLKRARGCAKCAGTGYYGRIAVDEFMITTPELRSAIQSRATRAELWEILKRDGFRTYIEDGIDKALAGITTFDEVDELYEDVLKQQ